MMRTPNLLLAGALLGASLHAAPQRPGDLVQAPDGAYFQLDPNQGGGASSVELRRVVWGRLVDVYGLDSAGAVLPQPILTDVVIRPELMGDGVDYELEESPVTQRTGLIILREFQGAGGASDPFVRLLQDAQRALPLVDPKSDAIGTAPPFSTVPRNAALVLQVDDLLADGPLEAGSLASNVRVLTGEPVSQPFSGRVLFDTAHGGLAPASAGGGFHATRVLIDTTISSVDALGLSFPAPLNALGLPSSNPDSTGANVSVRVPTKLEPAIGQFTLLTNLSGVALSPGAGPSDPGSPTIDVVRAMRSGNGDDAFKGFLADATVPRLLGEWRANVDAATDDPAGAAGLDFVIELRFLTPCRTAPQPGHVLELPGLMLEVTQAAAGADPSGLVSRVHVTSLGGPTTTAALLGGANYVLPYNLGTLDKSLAACWLSFTPTPGALPGTDVDPASQVRARFSEPLDPATVSAYDTFAILRDVTDPAAHDVVPADVIASADLMNFTSTPLLPLSHEQGTAEAYRLWFGGREPITDLAGNPLAGKPGTAGFTVDAGAPTQLNGGVVLRFNDIDEVRFPAAADGASDVRGQFVLDVDEGLLKARPVLRFSGVADRTQTVPSVMVPFPGGVRTPLNPLGSKMMNVWRYVDVGMSAADESTHNLDVEGLAWAPLGGQVVTDFFPEFEMRLSHSNRLPDEHLSFLSLLPTYPDSGLTVSAFDDNILQDPESPQKVVHPRALGYAINPLDLFQSSSGTTMIPWPLNESGGPYESYLWRDTAVAAVGAPNGAGIEQHIEEDLGVIPPGAIGAIAPPGQVPSIGLPLLMEFRCYPSSTSVGLNALDVSIAVNTSSRPSFRITSNGGIDTTGNPVLVDPDLESVPSGGFNPSSTPPGGPTAPSDNIFSIGQMELVTRVSRAHTAWIDTGVDGGGTQFLTAQVLPSAMDLPAGTEVIVQWRGASALNGSAQTDAFDADLIGPYGSVRPDAATYLGADGDVVFFPAGDASWKDDLGSLDGARFVQGRVTFVGNQETMEAAAISSLAIAFDRP